MDELRESGWVVEHGDLEVEEWLHRKLNGGRKRASEVMREEKLQAAALADTPYCEEVWENYGTPFVYFFIITVIAVGGTVFWMQQEDLGLSISFHLSFVTISTVGYGDYHPTTDVAKVFCMFYVVIGLGVLTKIGTMVCDDLMQKK